VIDRQDQAPASGFVNHTARLIHRRRHRLFDEDVLAGHHRFHRKFEMGGNRCRDCDRMDAGIAQNLLEIAGDFHGRIARLNGR
jgi:hypothetical protein